MAESGKELAQQELSKVEAETIAAREKLEAFAKYLPSSEVFRNAGFAFAADTIIGLLTGRWEIKSASEAAKVAEAIVKMVNTNDLADVGSALSNVDDPAERKRLLAEFKEKAQKASEK